MNVTTGPEVDVDILGPDGTELVGTVSVKPSSTLAEVRLLLKVIRLSSVLRFP